MNSKYFLIALAGLLATASAVTAQGWYLGGFGGISDTDDAPFGTALGTVTPEFDSGTTYGAVLGYDTSTWRFEGEISMRDGDVENHILGAAPLPGPTGEASSTAFLANVIYDFNRDGSVRPYVGAGLGYLDVDFENFGVTPIPDVLDDSDSSLAYQLLVGIGFALNADWSLFVDYRWLTADDLSLTASPSAGSTMSDVDYEVQDFTVGLRYSF